MPATRLHIYDRAVYQIVVQGCVPLMLSDYLGGMRLDATYDDADNPITVLSGEVLDQAALAGILQSLFNLQFPILLMKFVRKAED